jgi:transposase-like protein
MSRVFWTKRDEYVLRKMTEIGYFASQIGNVLGKSIGAIDSKRFHDNIKSGGSVDVVDDEEVKAILAEADAANPPIIAVQKARFQHWTPEQDSQLRDLVEKKYRDIEIAKIFGTTKKSVEFRRYYLDISKRKRCKNWTEEERQVLKSMYEAGKSDDEIAGKLGRPWSSIEFTRKQMKLIREEQRRARVDKLASMREADIRKYFAEYASRKLPSELAKDLNIGRERILKLGNEYHIDVFVYAKSCVIEDIELIICRFDDGEGLDDIAREYEIGDKQMSDIFYSYYVKEVKRVDWAKLPEDDIRAYLKETMDYEKVAEKFGLTVLCLQNRNYHNWLIDCRCYEIGEELAGKIKADLEGGLGYDEIAEKYDVSCDAIARKNVTYWHVKQTNIFDWTNINHEAVKEFLESSGSLIETAKKFNIPKNALYYWARKNKVYAIYWTQEEYDLVKKTLEETRDFYETSKLCGVGVRRIARQNRKNGRFPSFCVDMPCEFGKQTFGKDGILYRSIFEASVADYLFDAKIPYEDQKQVCKERCWRCDFYLPKQKLWLEVDGLGDTRKEYDRTYQVYLDKINYYKSNNYNYFVLPQFKWQTVLLSLIS